jgi:hypothetical protein
MAYNTSMEQTTAMAPIIDTEWKTLFDGVIDVYGDGVHGSSK